MEKESVTWLRYAAIFLMYLLCGIVIAGILAQIVNYFLPFGMSVSHPELMEPSARIKLANTMRLTVIIQHFFVFSLPSIFFLIFLFKKTGKWWFGKDHVTLVSLLLGALVLLSSIPLVQFSAKINGMIPMPSQFDMMEEEAAKLIKLFLYDHNFGNFLVNLVIIAILPSISEELIFRGCIQTLVNKISGNGHIAVWVTAIIFSAIHFQFEGFIPRVILGVMLGYLFYWTGNLIFPMFAHFVNNSIPVIAQYFLNIDPSEIENINDDQIPFWVVVGSVFVLMFLISQFKKSISQQTLT